MGDRDTVMQLITLIHISSFILTEPPRKYFGKYSKTVDKNNLKVSQLDKQINV